jgi:hypothetical protein
LFYSVKMSLELLRTPLRTRWLRLLFILSLCFLILSYTTNATAIGYDDITKQRSEGDQNVLASKNEDDDFRRPSSSSRSREDVIDSKLETLPAMIDTLDVMQEKFFEPWVGVWPTGIDWTTAFIGTLVSSGLSTISTSHRYLAEANITAAILVTEKAHENLINRYFTHLIASYFGQQAFRIRQEGFDDMLWVVLGWLETVKFIRSHSDNHFKEPQRPSSSGSNASPHSSWYGKEWVSGFAHRARLFWDLAEKGWDTTLCDGGMLWTPHTDPPYKNAITNELWIAASIAMYLHFPGDDNTSPYHSHSSCPLNDSSPAPGSQDPDPKYLVAAVEGYKWLKASNMTNQQGLYVDGFHISGWEKHPRNGTLRNTKCDERNGMVYTYNQGVMLSGQRGLWEATGAKSYLEDGHELIADVVAATGWDLSRDAPVKEDNPKQWPVRRWRGMGRSGILEDYCDARAQCSQDGQAFKGIFFHHLTAFCMPLPIEARFRVAWDEEEQQILRDTQAWHEEHCARYGGWIRHNAKAALTTRNDQGLFGQWWGAPSRNASGVEDLGVLSPLPDDAVDYRNGGTHSGNGGADDRGASSFPHSGRRDLNDRGRGRTLETQGGGLAVLRALWEVVDLPTMAAQMGT